MIAHHRQKCMLGIGGAVLVALTAGLLRTVLPDPVRVFLILGAVVLWLWAVAHLAAGRGHDPILGVIFGLLGVGVLFLRPRLHQSQFGRKAIRQMSTEMNYEIWAVRPSTELSIRSSQPLAAGRPALADLKH